MNETQQKRISRFLSLVLRHDPAKVGLKLADGGWVPVDSLLAAINGSDVKFKPVSLQQLQVVVRENDKQRFEFSDDESMIRASQGHSIDVDLGNEEATPPDVLYHGTPEKFVEPITREGLTKQKRHHVHLSAETQTASAVGQRRGKPVVLVIDAKLMHQNGHAFFVTTNGVWLTDHVPPDYLTVPEH